VATDYLMKWMEVVPLKNMTQGSYKLCIGTHCAQVWIAVDFDDGPRHLFHVTPIQGVCTFPQDKVAEFFTLLCLGQRAGRIKQQDPHKTDKKRK
jgi:hypothetical protein